MVGGKVVGGKVVGGKVVGGTDCISLSWWFESGPGIR